MSDRLDYIDWIKANSYFGVSARFIKSSYEDYLSDINVGYCPKNREIKEGESAGYNFGCGLGLGCRKCWQIAFEFWENEIKEDPDFWKING